MYLPKFKFLKDVAKPGAFSLPGGGSFAGGLIKDFLGRAFKGSSPAGLDAEKDQLIDLGTTAPVDKQFVTQLNPPNSKDYAKGSFARFFIKDSRNDKIIEVKKDSYRAEKDEGKLYRRILRIEWYVTGPLKDQLINGYLHPGTESKNQDVINQAEKILPGIGAQILKDPGQFVLSKNEISQLPKPKGPKVKENLFTNGKEFVNVRTGQEYVGPYHIHPSKGAMVGAVHVPEKHDKLAPFPEMFKGSKSILPPILKPQPEEEFTFDPKPPRKSPISEDDIIDAKQRKKMDEAKAASEEKERYEEEQKETIEQLQEDRDTDRQRIAALEQQVAQLGQSSGQAGSSAY
mgnify:FL=1